MKSLILIGLALAALLLLLILIFPQNTQKDKPDENRIIKDSYTPTV